MRHNKDFFEGALVKIGVSAFAWTTKFTPSSFGLLPKLREANFDGFEIPMFDPAELAAKKIRQACEANHLECTVCAILPNGINPIDPDSNKREKAVAHLHQCIDVTAELGAKLIAGPLFAPIGYLPGRRRNVEEWNFAVEAFQRLGDALEASDIALSLEPVNRSETFFLNTAADAKSLCETIGHPRIGVTVDTFHANIEEKNTAAAVESLGGRLKHVHASENDRGLLGSGHVDFPAILAALRRIAYDGYLMIEGFGFSRDETNILGALWADPTVSPEDIAFRGAAYLRRLLGSTELDP